MAAQLPHLDDITRLSPSIIRVLGGNPGKFTLQGTNTYLIGTGSSRILLDTGEGNTTWPKTLETALKNENASIEKILLTHWHPDHVGGVKDALALFPDAKVFKNQLSPGDQTNILDGEVFNVEGATLRAFHSPGHTVDHMAFILREENAMFTGDNVLGHGTAVFEDLPAYLNSLERMEKEFDGRAYPGHGDVIDDGRAKINEYVEHRRDREEHILGVMKGGKANGEGWRSMEIVKVVYQGYPENLHGPAEGGVVQVLGKLEGEGRVKKEGDRWRLVEGGKL